jgi:hypothetical protein
MTLNPPAFSDQHSAVSQKKNTENNRHNTEARRQNENQENQNTVVGREKSECLESKKTGDRMSREQARRRQNTAYKNVKPGIIYFSC